MLRKRDNRNYDIHFAWGEYFSGYENNQLLPYDEKTDTISDGKQTKSIVRQLNYSLFCENNSFEVTILTSWIIVLGCYSDCTDIALFTDYSGNRVPMRIAYDRQETIASLKTKVAEHMNILYEHDYMNEYQLEEESLIYVGFHEARSSVSNNFSVIFNSGQKNTSYSLFYNCELFRSETIERISSHFETVLFQVLYSVCIRMSEINILGEKEYDRVIKQFNKTDLDYDEQLSIDAFFEKSADKFSNNIAIVCGERCLNYGDLNHKSDVLASNMYECYGIKRGDIIGLIMHRDIELIITIMAVLKLGAAYLPIDTHLPKNRICIMLERAEVEFIVIDYEDRGNLDEKYQLIDIYYILARIPIEEKRLYKHSKDDLAYILYTSGTTGFPKGVAVNHKNVVGYIYAFLNEFKLTHNDIMLQQSVISFDISVEEIFPILMVGGTMVIAQEEQIEDPVKLIALIDNYSVTILSGFPLLLKQLNKYDLPISLKTIISGGDILHKEYITNISCGRNIYNTYGPSETTVCASYYKYLDENAVQISIGRPIANYKIYILNHNKKPVPIGIPGIICIGGVGVSRGYYKQEELTKERFIKNPLHPKDKIFITGDIGKWNYDGTIQFIGRIDNQVMVRGKRTELEEVKRVLLSHPKLNDAFISAERDNQGDLFLTAFVTTESILSRNELIAYLGKYLPEFMIPEYYVLVDCLPISSNGKVNKDRLPVIIK